MNVKPIMTVIFSMIFIGLAASALSWLLELKKKDCTCAEDASYKFLVFMCCYVIVMSLLGSIVAVKTNGEKPSPKLKSALAFIGFLNLSLTISFIVIGLKYVKKLKERECACALDDPRRVIFQAWLWTYVGVCALVVLLVAISMAGFFYFLKRG